VDPSGKVRASSFQSNNPHTWLSEYLRTRAQLASQDSDFQCDPGCARPGCKNRDLQVPVTIIDLLGVAQYLEEPVSSIFRRHYILGLFSDDRDGWLRTVALCLKKPCPFLENDLCSIYPVRPLPCMLFPEYLVSRGTFAAHAAQDQFRDYLCLRRPLVLSPERAKVVLKLRSMFEREMVLSAHHLFHHGPCHIDFSTIANEPAPAGSSVVALSEEKPKPQSSLTNQDLEHYFRERFGQFPPFVGVADRISHLDTQEGQAQFRDFFQNDLLYRKLRQAGDDRALVYRLKKGKLRVKRRSILPAELKFY
jgi:Fe-S-cluster containining protein